MISVYISDTSGNEVAYIGRYVGPRSWAMFSLSRDFKERKLIETIMAGGTEFSYTDESLIITEDEEPVPEEEDEANILATDDVSEAEAPVSATAEYTIHLPEPQAVYPSAAELKAVFHIYSSPEQSHWLGTDRYGMDVLARMMYGGRVSLMVGFVVVIWRPFSVSSLAVSQVTSEAG